MDSELFEELTEDGLKSPVQVRLAAAGIVALETMVDRLRGQPRAHAAAALVGQHPCLAG